jgi:hypothetical protein
LAWATVAAPAAIIKHNAIRVISMNGTPAPGCTRACYQKSRSVSVPFEIPDYPAIWLAMIRTMKG